VRRAGKPEFVGVTELAINAGDLEANPDEVCTPSSKIAHCHYVPTLDGLRSKVEDLLAIKNLSIPLELNLLAIKSALDHPWSRNRIEAALQRSA
jgi:hypothetical protein